MAVTAALAVPLVLPARALAQTVGSFEVEGGTQDVDYAYEDGTLTILTSEPLEISLANGADSTADAIVVAENVTAYLTLDDGLVSASGAGEDAVVVPESSAAEIVVTDVDGSLAETTDEEADEAGAAAEDETDADAEETADAADEDAATTMTEDATDASDSADLLDASDATSGTYTWEVTSSRGQGLQRYLLLDGELAPEGLHYVDGYGWTYVLPQGYVLRGKYDTGGGYVYIADNDGRLPSTTGWLVTGTYDNGTLQRYYIDATTHAAKSGLFEVDGSYYWGMASQGYVLRGFGSANGTSAYANNDGVLQEGWLVTTGFGQGLQRYWLIHGMIPSAGLYQTGDSSWTYVLSAGYVLRGKYDTGGGYVYVADNDGALPTTTGWLVTSAYDGGLQRYYIDATTHAAKSGLFEVDGSTYYGVGGEGYVVRNACFKSGSKWYYANNDGVATYLASGKIGYQNPSGYYQVSAYDVSVPSGYGIFSYASPSMITPDATREECVEAFISRAYDYLGTPYKWDYACAPGVGVDCAGLVLQCLYAVGIDLGELNPYNHYYTAGHDQYANWMRSLSGFLHVSFSQRQRGDLIFWSGHVAIYLGNDQIIEASGSDVHITSVYAYGTPLAVARVFQ